MKRVQQIQAGVISEAICFNPVTYRKFLGGGYFATSVLNCLSTVLLPLSNPKIAFFATAFLEIEKCEGNKKRQRTKLSRGDLGTRFFKVPITISLIKKVQHRCSKLKNIDVATQLIVTRLRR